jgi:SAM-dependent methyltransferase
VTKYSADYAMDYACLWAFGKELFGLEGTESLYRAVSENAQRTLRGLPEPAEALVVEIGCGTGRNIRDLAKENPSTKFVGVDASSEMLNVARAILLGDKDILFSPTHRGFPTRRMEPFTFDNVELVEPAEFRSTVGPGVRLADICISVNCIERTNDIDDYIQLLFQSLRSGGRLIIATSLNWICEEHWHRFPSFASLLRNLCANDHFKVVSLGNDIDYFEQTDVRGSGEFYVVSMAELEKLG